MPRIPIKHFLFVSLFAACLATFIFAVQPSQSTDNEKINRLMEERRDALQKIVEVFKSKYDRGMVKIDTVYRAQNDLLNAELDLATTKGDRVAIMKKQLENFQSMESRALELQKIGAQGGEVEVVLTATAARLQAEIQWLRESRTSD